MNRRSVLTWTVFEKAWLSLKPFSFAVLPTVGRGRGSAGTCANLGPVAAGKAAISPVCPVSPTSFDWAMEERRVKRA